MYCFLVVRPLVRLAFFLRRLGTSDRISAVIVKSAPEGSKFLPLRSAIFEVFQKLKKQLPVSKNRLTL